MQERINSKYYKINQKRKVGFFALLILLVFLIFYCTTVGYADTSMKDVFYAVKYFVTGEVNESIKIANYKIILLMRLPRIIMGVLAGISLSISGAVMQSITKNPLVSPFTIGISNAAALGASIAIVFFTNSIANREIFIVISAFVFACLCAFFLFEVSNILGSSPTAIVLTGIALNYFFSAASSSIKYFSDDRNLAEIVHWSFGSFNGAMWIQNLVILVALIFGLIPIFKYQKMLEIMSVSSDEYVLSLGINPEFVRRITGIASVLLTAVVISFTGVIGFIGIVAPHIARIFVGSNYKYMIPYSALIGSILLVVSDTIGRVIISPTLLPVGIVTSFIGTPLFIYLLVKQRRNNYDR